MRLTCPNCAAQYEVDDSVIPDSGRDVQCSNCGETWFQPSAATLRSDPAVSGTAPIPDDWEPEGIDDFEDEVAVEIPAPPKDQDLTTDLAPDAPADSAPEAPTSDAPHDDTPPPEAPAATMRPVLETEEAITAAVAAMMGRQASETARAEPDDSDLSPAPTAGSTPRRTLDDSLLSILREEAEREAEARRAEGSSLETQEELNLEAQSAAPALAAAVAPAFADAEADDRVAHLYGDDAEDAPSGRGTPGTRRERLPNIEEINSTLRATSDREGQAAAIDAPQTLARQRSGFRRGFSTVLVIAALAVLTYALAPRISEAVPALQPTMDAYVAAVLKGRIWLDGELQSVIEKLQPDEG